MKDKGRESGDRELMLFVDDELDQERRADVQVRLRNDRDAQRKVAAMRMVGDIVRESAVATDTSVADGIADSVMARIAAEPKTARDAAARDKVVPMRGKPKGGDQDMSAARRIYAAAALAVALAAGLMIWGKIDARAPIAQTPVTTPAQVADPSPAARQTAPPAVDDTPTPDRDVEIGVEVAAVDFGASHGSVFYVPGDAAGTGRTTAVVWITDDVAGEEQ